MYQYIPREKLQSIIDIADFEENVRVEIAYQYFVYDNQEAMYVEKNGMLIGIVSIGDLERYYSCEKNTLEINCHFSYTNRINTEKASDFFEKYTTFFEFPVVNDCGQLEGVLRRERRYDVRQDQIASLVVSKYLKEQWHKRELKRFILNTKAKVILYYTEYSLFSKKLVKGNLSYSEENKENYWKGLSKKQWDDFLGEPDSVENLKKEFGNFHTELVKGISKVVDMDGEFFRCVNGNRITSGNPESSERRIIFYGPCTFVGAYGRDEQTIASYFQKVLNSQIDLQIQVINKGLFNMTNFFSRMMTDELSERDIAIIYIEKRWLTEEISHKCVYVNDLADTFLGIKNLEKNILDSPEHCNYKVNKCLAEKIYHDFEEHNLFDEKVLSGERKQIQDYYIGSEIMSEVLLYMERYNLVEEGITDIRGAMTLLADPFTGRHRRAVEAALQKVDKLYLFISEDSNLEYTLEERMLLAKDALADLENKVTVVPAGKYLYTKKISRGIRKQRFCNDDMEYDCDIFGEIFGRFIGIKYRFVMNELNNSVERKYMDTCIEILPRFGIEVEEL